MGDLLDSTDIFKKLGFDSSNQWIFYDERVQQFFKFFAENITDANNVTEHEVLEQEELKKRKEWLDNEERLHQRQELENENPHLFDYTDNDVIARKASIKTLEDVEQGYDTLLQQISESKNNLNVKISKLDADINCLNFREKEILQACQAKAKQLEELQLENNNLCQEMKKCFKQSQTPPLFVHQLPVDQYFLKCETFIQYFSLYLMEHFKIQECLELEQKDDDIGKLASKLDTLESTLNQYTSAFINTKAELHAKESVIQMQDISQIHILSIADMQRETRELQILNAHLENTYTTLSNDLEMHIVQHTQQRLEQILYENTKCKLERALKNRDNGQVLSKIISDALSNAELLWIIMQLDMEKKRNRFDNTEQLNAKCQATWQRIYAMRALQSMDTGISHMFLEKYANLLAHHLGVNVRAELKSCLYEYEKFGRSMVYACQAMLNKKAYAGVLDKLSDLKRTERVLRAWVYDSPVVRPMFENVRYLRPIFKAKMQVQRIDKVLRNLRIQFQDNITMRMENDKLWRDKQLLWMWFLTEPKRVMRAIEDVKKAAAKVPSMTGIKVLGGIKRK